MSTSWPRGAVTILIAWICLTGAVNAQPLTFPTLSGRVVDEAGLLGPADRTALTNSLASLEAKTTDQLVVVTLKSLQGRPIADYGYQLGRHWQIGQKDKNNGALLVVAASERQVRIEVGYGLEGTLTDALTRFIIETAILPRFKAGDLSGGIKLGVERITQVLTGDADDLKRSAAQRSSGDLRQPSADTSMAPIIVVVVVGVGLLIFCSVIRGGLCQGILQILFLMTLSGRGRGSRGGSSFSGGGGSFGGGGSSGSW